MFFVQVFSLDTPQVVNTFYLESEQHVVDIEVGKLFNNVYVKLYIEYLLLI